DTPGSSSTATTDAPIRRSAHPSLHPGKPTRSAPGNPLRNPGATTCQRTATEAETENTRNHFKATTMKTASYTLGIAHACLSELSAQTPSPKYSFRAIVQPGTAIAGHTFIPNTYILAAALNDNGDIAFIASWQDTTQKYHCGVFTNKRVVVRSGEIIDG